VKFADKARFYHQLARQTAAGMPLPKALQRLAETRGATQRTAALHLLHLLAEEVPPAHRSGIGSLEESLMEAGKRSGRIPETLDLLAEHFAGLAAARARVVRGSVYPLLVVHLAILLLGLPVLFQPDGGMAVYVGGVIRSLFVLYVLLGGLLLAGKVLWWFSCRVETAEQLLLWIPVLGNLRRQWSAAQFATTLGLFFQSAAGVLGALKPAARAAESPGAMRASQQVAEEVRSGSSLGEAMQRAGVFPAELVEAVFTGEETGRLGEELARCSQHLRESLARALETLSVWMPRLLYAGVVVYTAYRIIDTVGGYYRSMGDLLSL
jgi:general secretion pathway protein F